MTKPHKGISRPKPPKAPRWRIVDADTGLAVAIVEAADEFDAFTRYKRAKAVLRSDRFATTSVSVREQSPRASATDCAFFSGLFFDVLDASEVLKN